jgi:hypothetical protein
MNIILSLYQRQNAIVTVTVTPFRHRLGNPSTRCRICRMTPWYTFCSRYLETDHLSEIVWQLFGHTPLGWARVRRSATWSTAISRSIMRTPMPPGWRWRRSMSDAASAAILPTFQWLCAAA